MAKDSITGSSGRKRQLFARRQVYLRTGQDSQYVELSPVLQVGLGFALFALWLVGASYGAFNWASGGNNNAALLAKLNSKEQALDELEQERNAALEDAARIADLEAALDDAQALAAEESKHEEARELSAELQEAKTQLEELQLRFSESKADHAALQARFEAELSATTDDGEKTAEEASSLHEQLEQAFSEMETLQEERDTATAKLEAASEADVIKDEAIERNTDLLKAATAEIERLKETITRNNASADDDVKWREETIGKLETDLGDAVAAREDLEREVADLRLQADEVETVAAAINRSGGAVDGEAQVAIDAAVHAQSIAAGLKEADLLVMIDDLRAELAARSSTPVAADTSGDTQDVTSLRERVAVAETEIERLILSGLKASHEPASAPTNQPVSTPADPDENERLRAELLATQADVIKLKSDVKAAKGRLAEQVTVENGQISRPDNSAKLEQQLASTRSRVQQLNKALADAKLREVAIDLALISVVPSPSPPAPR